MCILRTSICFIVTEDTEMRGATMSLTAATSGFVVFLLSVPVIQGQTGWGVTYSSTKICPLKGSTVDIPCTYRYPSRINGRDTTVENTFWFYIRAGEPVDLRTDPEYAGRVQYYLDENNCTLRIRDLRESDSAEYNFMFVTNQRAERSTVGSPGVTLTVTDPGLQVVIELIRHQGYRRAELECRSSCRLPDRSSYIWYKSGQEMKEETSSVSVYLDTADSFSCALKGREDFSSPSVCVAGQYCNSVMYNDRRVCAFKGSSVTIYCMYSSYGYMTSNFWFSPERSDRWQNPSQPEDLSQDSQYAGRVQVKLYGGRCSLRITDLRDSDSAQYRFKFKTGSFEWRSSLPGTTLTVTDPDLQLQVVRRRSFWHSSQADLECHSNCRLPHGSSYIWYENGQKIWKATSSHRVDFGSTRSYSCAVKGHEEFPSPSVCVNGQMCNRVTYTDRSMCVSKGSSVNISCTYNSYEDHIKSKFWFSPERSGRWQNPSDLSEDSQYAGRVQVLETERGRSTLRITDLRDTDAAEYCFKFKTQRFEWMSILPGTTLTVTDLQVQVTRKTVHQFYTEAELKCQSSCGPAGRLSYVWLKNGEKIRRGETSSYKDRFHPGDIISCALEGHEDHGSLSVYALKVPFVSVSSSGEITEGIAVTLTCSIDANSAANYTWSKENRTLLRKEPQLVFSSIRSSDSGEYYCAAENELGRRTSEYISIDVKYAPKLPSVSVSPSGEIVEGSSVTLRCSSDANPAAKYTWYKKNQTLLQGAEGSYHFTSISSEDRGIYYCKSENKYGQINSSSVFIDVQYAPKLLSVSVSPSAEIVEGSSVNLTCSSDANPAANFTWYKENEDSPKASGQIFSITDFRAEHSGSYYCVAENRRGRRNNTLHLTVAARAWKSRAVGTTAAVLLAVILLSVFILTRKKRAAKHSSEPGERLDFSQQRQMDDRQADLQYASVHFSNMQRDSLYYNVRPAQQHRHKREESVVYAAVKFNSGSTDPRIPEDDSHALYSTINKTC